MPAQAIGFVVGLGMGWQGLSAAPGDLGVKPLADQRFPRLLSVFLVSSFRLYARWAKAALTMSFWSDGGAGRCAEVHSPVFCLQVDLAVGHPRSIYSRNHKLNKSDMKKIAQILTLVSAAPVVAEPLDVLRDCDVCPDMIELPIGEFVMGAAKDEFPRALVFYDGEVQLASKEHPSLKEDEGPKHKVAIDVRIAIGRNEVTYSQWMACVSAGGCGGYVPQNELPPVGSIDRIVQSLSDNRFGSEVHRATIADVISRDEDLQLSGDFPVVYISYLDAQRYVLWLNKKLGTTSYRLPTEAEWEYAARSGSTTRFAQGDNINSAQANFSGEDTEYMLQGSYPDFLSRGFPVPVSELNSTNSWGLRHMSGNVFEVTLSCYSVRYVGWSTASEWLEKSSGISCERSIRGGSYANSVDTVRVAWRAPRAEGSRSQFVGFRVVKELE
jgi:formylglycine-generating enzyme required for sulfatase activity